MASARAGSRGFGTNLRGPDYLSNGDLRCNLSYSAMPGLASLSYSRQASMEADGHAPVLTTARFMAFRFAERIWRLAGYVDLQIKTAP